jgi:hypothetical protein
VETSLGWDVTSLGELFYAKMVTLVSKIIFSCFKQKKFPLILKRRRDNGHSPVVKEKNYFPFYPSVGCNLPHT